MSGPEWVFFLYFKYWYFRSLKRFWDCDFFWRCPWTSWSEHGRTKNDMYNKRVLIWHFTLVFMKSYAGNWQINCNSRNWRNQMTEQYRTIGPEIQKVFIGPAVILPDLSVGLMVFRFHWIHLNYIISVWSYKIFNCFFVEWKSKMATKQSTNL